MKNVLGFVIFVFTVVVGGMSLTLAFAILVRTWKRIIREIRQ